MVNRNLLFSQYMHSVACGHTIYWVTTGIVLVPVQARYLISLLFPLVHNNYSSSSKMHYSSVHWPKAVSINVHHVCSGSFSITPWFLVSYSLNHTAGTSVHRHIGWKHYTLYTDSRSDHQERKANTSAYKVIGLKLASPWSQLLSRCDLLSDVARRTTTVWQCADVMLPDDINALLAALKYCHDRYISSSTSSS